jgi:hypothetical protein
MSGIAGYDAAYNWLDRAGQRRREAAPAAHLKPATHADEGAVSRQLIERASEVDGAQ